MSAWQEHYLPGFSAYTPFLIHAEPCSDHQCPLSIYIYIYIYIYIHNYPKLLPSWSPVIPTALYPKYPTPGPDTLSRLKTLHPRKLKVMKGLRGAEKNPDPDMGLCSCKHAILTSYIRNFIQATRSAFSPCDALSHGASAGAVSCRCPKWSSRPGSCKCNRICDAGSCNNNGPQH